MSRDLSMSHDLSVSAHDLTVLHTICGVMHNVSVLLVGLHILNLYSGPICQPQRDWLGLHSVWGGVSGAVLNKLYWCRGGGLGSGPYCSVAQLWLMLQECLHVKERQGVRHYWHYDALSSTVCGDGVVRDDGGEIRWGASSSPPILPISGLESLDFAQ